MSRFRRYFSENTPIFITAVCHQRKPYLSSIEQKQRLLSVMREVKQELKYRILGYVLLDDHFHWIILPADEKAYPHIMQSVKLRFVRRMPEEEKGGDSRIWQRRYWDHLIRDQQDLHRHLDYIHYNPVKHGYTEGAADYPWSSFNEYRKRGQYRDGWGKSIPSGVNGLMLSDVD